MKNLGLKFYKFRILILLNIMKFLAFILRVEIPPIFSVGAIIKKDEKYLFLDLTYLKGYCFPGGHVRAGENLSQTLRREVHEETGLEIINSNIFKSYSYKNKGIDQVVVTFFVEAKGGLRESEEGKLYWLRLEDVVGKMAYEDNEMLVKDLLSK